MKYIKLGILILLLPFFELFIMNRYIISLMEINLLLSLAVYLSLKEDRNMLFFVFITGIVSDIFNNDIIGINALLFLIISFIIYYSKSFVIIASRLAEMLMLSVSFLTYLVIKLFLLYFSGNSVNTGYSPVLFIKTVSINVLSGLLLFYLLDWISVSREPGSSA